MLLLRGMCRGTFKSQFEGYSYVRCGYMPNDSLKYTFANLFGIRSVMILVFWWLSCKGVFEAALRGLCLRDMLGKCSGIVSFIFLYIISYV